MNITNPEKIYFPTDKITKKDVVNYYEKISTYILPYLKDRPESLNRHPNGIDKPNFFQKNITNPVPDFAKTIHVKSDSRGEVNYLICNNTETLLYMANLGCIEINPWSSRVQNLDKPDFMVIDLDPGKNTLQELVQVAQKVHEILDAACEANYVKTSGKRGLHIFIPLGAKYHYDEIREFSELLVNIVHSELPGITSVERSPAKRKKLIYLDFLQNSRGQTLAAPYSLRPIDGVCVSTPLEWNELGNNFNPKHYNIKTIFARLNKKGDIWKPVLGKGIDLHTSVDCLRKLLEKSSV